MTKLLDDISRTYELGNINNHPVLAGEKIYEGAVVGLDENGYARPLVAGDKFVGFADRFVDNTNGSDGEVSIAVRDQGKIVLDIEGLSLNNVGQEIYASDDNSFTLEEEGNTYIGVISRVIGSEVLVSFSANTNRSRG